MSDLEVFTAAYMKACENRSADWNEIGYWYARSLWDAAIKHERKSCAEFLAHTRKVRNESADDMRREIRLCRDEIANLRSLAATCYAGLGAECDLPERWLDVLSAAAHGEPFDTEDLLPYTASVQPTKPFTEEEKAALRKWATEGDERDTLERADAIRARGHSPDAGSIDKTVSHAPGCPAFGGYGHGIEPCACGMVKTDAEG